jgi:hypothetical protein
VKREDILSAKKEGERPCDSVIQGAHRQSLVPVGSRRAALADYKPPTRSAYSSLLMVGFKVGGSGLSRWAPVYLLSRSAGSYCPMSPFFSILLRDLEDEPRPDQALVAEGPDPVSQQACGYCRG